MTKKRIVLNAFDSMNICHMSTGTWRHPESQKFRFDEIEYWTNMARELERGHFDCLFIADALGYPDEYRGSAAAALKEGAHIPQADPFAVISAMAAVTENVGFGITAATTFEHPYLLARRLATLDRFTKGRVAWNVVSSYQNSAAVNVGMEKQMAHDERYEMAEEYMEVVYKLWEGSWEVDAIQRNKETGIVTDPTKVHPIHHQGKYYKVPGFLSCFPSQQRTPVIFQAGASSKGRAFAGRHAEGIFILTTGIEHAKAMTKQLRDEAEAAGRPRDSVKIFTLLTVITGATDEAAERKYREYLSYASTEGMLAMFGSWTGVDFSNFNPDQPVAAVENDSMRGMLESLSTGHDGKTWTVRELIHERCIGGMGPTFVGGPKKVADMMERWVDEGGVDGFNLSYAVTPAGTTNFIDYVVPELVKRGRVQTSYRPGTLREKLLGRDGPFTEPTHPASRQRGAYVGKESVDDKTKASNFSDDRILVQA